MGWFQELRVILGLKTDPFEQGIRRATMSGARFATNLKNQLAGAFSVGAITAATKSIIEYGGHIADLSKKTQVSAEMLQAFALAAKESGASIDDVAQAFRGLAKARIEALGDPKGKTAAAFTAFGIDRATLQAGNLVSMFQQISRMIQLTNFGADELPLVEAVLGRASGDLIPAMKEGLADAANNAQILAGVLKDDVVQQLDAAGDAVGRLVSKFRADLAPAVAFVATAIRRVWGFTEGVVAGTAGGIATLLGGGSLRDAQQLAAELFNKSMAESKAGTGGVPRPGEPDFIGPVRQGRAPLNFFNSAAGSSLAAATGGFGFRPSSDQLSRIGGFVGGAGNVQSMISRMADDVKRVRNIVEGFRSTGIQVKE